MQTGSRLLRLLDAAWKIGMWEMDVAVPFLACLLGGMMYGTGWSFAISVALGILIGMLVSRVKAEKPNGYALHLIWWVLPDLFLRMKATPPSHMRQMVG